MYSNNYVKTLEYTFIISSIQIFMNLGQELAKPKIKNLISFSKDSSTIFMNDNKNDLSIRNEDSFSFDYQRQANNLGISYMHASQKDLAKSIYENTIRVTSSQSVLKRLRQINGSLQRLKSEIQQLKSDQLNMSKQINFSQLVDLINQQQMKQSSFLKCEDSLLISNQSQRQIRRNFSIQSSISIKIDGHSMCEALSDNTRSRSMDNDGDNNLVRQIEQLKYSIELKNNKIELLSKQIATIKSLNEKKQSMYEQKMKLKQIEWQKKLNDILKDHHETKINSKQKQKQKQKSHGYRKNSWKAQSRKRQDQDQLHSIVYGYRCQTQTNQEDPHVQQFRLNTSTERLIRSKAHANDGQYAGDSRIKVKNWRNLMGKEQSKYSVGQNLRPLKTSRQRKKSSDLTYEQAKKKIKTFESSLKKQISSIQAQ